MTRFKNIFAACMTIALATSCQDGYIDPIERVAPGQDAAAPSVTVTYPAEGALIRVREDVTPITIKLEATDDIEVAGIVVKLDGTQIAQLSDFKDYRRALAEVPYATLGNGAHTLAVTASDLAGNNTTSTVHFEKVAPYQPKYNGEIFYMPFDGDYLELVSITEATKVGSPGFTGSAKRGQGAYAGANNAYLTFPTTAIANNEFSASFWYNVNASPDRSGILTMGPPDPNNPNTPNNRQNGFRFFREGSPTAQTFKLNVGDGTADSWFDGGAAATVNPTTVDWVHIAFTISDSKVAVYINGNVVSQGNFAGVDWTGCDVLSIASGAPRFTEWGHLSDQSNIDELRIFNKALSQSEVQAVMNGN